MNRSIEFENRVIEVFKTNIDTSHAAFKTSKVLEGAFPGCYITFDLDDCDRVLRVEAPHAIDTNLIIALCHQLGVAIELLED